MNIQIGMGCENEQLCNQIGWFLALVFFIGLLYFCFYLGLQFWKNKNKQAAKKSKKKHQRGSP